MKKILTLLLALALCLGTVFSFSACELFTPEEKPEEQPEHTHEWADADCDTPKTCGDCGATEGEALGHSLNDATCTLPATCSVCGETEGEANGHTPAEDDFDCETAVECTVCGGEAIAAAEHADENNDGKCDSEGCNLVFFQPIYTADDLISAFENGGVYKLMNDINSGETAISIYGTSVSLDLGGFTLTTSFWMGINVGDDGSLRLSNGTVKNESDRCSALSSYGDTYISNCTLESNGYWSLYVADNTTVVENSVIKYGIIADGNETNAATIIATNNVTVVDADPENLGGISVDEYGKITLGFDPTSILEIWYNVGVVTDNGDGTWTVAPPPHTHSMSDATCTLPATCTGCGETEGEALGHSMNDATCLLPATCSVCGETEGEALGHSAEGATCTAAATCSVCGETVGEALGHSAEGATCTAAATCSVCGETVGDPLGHSADFKGACGVCGANLLQELKVGESLDLDFSTSSVLYFYIDTEIGQIYRIDKAHYNCSFSYDVYNESGEKIVGNSSLYQFRAEEEVYYFVATASSYNNTHTNTINLSYGENPYEAEGLDIHDIEVGKTLKTTVKDSSVWVKLDNTTGRYNDYIFLCSELTGSGNHYYYEGIVYSGWNTGSSYSLISPMDIDVRQVIYYRFNFNVEDGTEVSIDLVKPVKISSLGSSVTIKSTDSITEDGRAVFMKDWGDKLTYEVTTDIGTIETVDVSGGTYIGEANGVEYVQSTTVFGIELIVKVDNPEGSLTMVKHTTHIDSGDGNCICGAAIE